MIFEVIAILVSVGSLSRETTRVCGSKIRAGPGWHER